MKAHITCGTKGEGASCMKKAQGCHKYDGCSLGNLQKKNLYMSNILVISFQIKSQLFYACLVVCWCCSKVEKGNKRRGDSVGSRRVSKNRVKKQTVTEIL